MVKQHDLLQYKAERQGPVEIKTNNNGSKCHYQMFSYSLLDAVFADELVDLPLL